MDVGFVGLGQMGAAMAGRLLAAGHAVTVWNRDPAKAAPLVDAGARLAESPRGAAASGLVVSMLADDVAAMAIVEGDDGLLAAGPGLVHVSMSTLGVTCVDALVGLHAEAGQHLVGCPVLGRPDVAAAGQLSLIVGGRDADTALLAPLFETLGARAIRVGTAPSAAAAAKLALNASIAAISAMLGEAFAIAAGRGVDAATMAALFDETGFGQRIVAGYGQLIAQRRFEPAGFPARLGRKDLELAIAAAGPDAALPVARLLRDRLDAMIARGEGELDWSALGRNGDGL